jgi:hypothetical protein
MRNCKKWGTRLMNGPRILAGIVTGVTNASRTFSALSVGHRSTLTSDLLHTLKSGIAHMQGSESGTQCRGRQNVQSRIAMIHVPNARTVNIERGNKQNFVSQKK